MEELVNAMHIIIQIPGELYIKELLEFTRPITLRECMDFSEDHMEAVSTYNGCLLYTSPSPRDRTRSRMPSSA